MKSVDHGYDVTLNSRYLRTLVETIGRLLMESRHKVNDDVRCHAYEQLIGILEKVGHDQASIDKLREAYLNQPFVSGHGAPRQFEIVSETRTWNLKGFVEGTFYPNASDEEQRRLLEILKQNLGEAGFRVTSLSDAPPREDEK